MIFYYKNKESYLYPSNEKYEDDLTRYTYEKHYLYSDKDSIMPSLEYIISHNLSQASCVVPIEGLCVNYNNIDDIDIDFCSKNNISYFRLGRKGGAIVFFPGNIAIDAIYTGTNKELAYFFIRDFMIFLQNCGVDAEINNNDITINGKKIAGMTYAEILGKYSYLGMAISVNVDTHLIDKICIKPMIKIPDALSNYGITTEAIMKWALQWFNNHGFNEGESNG